MVRRREIPETGLQHHKEASHDHALPAASVSERSGTDKTEYRMTDYDKSTDKVARELEITISETYHLVAAALKALNEKACVLIKEMKRGSLSAAEIEAGQAEITEREKQVMHLKEAARRAEERLNDYLRENAWKGRKS